MTLPGYAHLGEKAAFAQSKVDMAMVACALERYRLAQGQYPDTLIALVPRFAAALPHDIINGQPLKYRRTENGRFTLYSVGWNEKDDGGVAVATKTNPPRQDQLQGDWVWQYPDIP
jgi:Tfp pilus assembly protein PilE